MFKGEERTRNQWLTELVTEVASTIWCLDKDLFWCLIEPLANGQYVFPISKSRRWIIVIFKSWVGSHIYCSTCDRPWTNTATHTVAYLTTCSCCGTIEWLNGSWEVVGFGFQRDNTLDRLYSEVIRYTLIGWSKLFYLWSLCKGDIVLIGWQNLSWVLFSCLLDEAKETTLHYFAINDKLSAKDLMPTMLGVNLCETKYLRVCQWATILLFNLMKVFHLLWWERKTFFFIELL